MTRQKSGSANFKPARPISDVVWRSHGLKDKIELGGEQPQVETLGL